MVPESVFFFFFFFTVCHLKRSMIFQLRVHSDRMFFSEVPDAYAYPRKVRVVVPTTPIFCNVQMVLFVPKLMLAKHDDFDFDSVNFPFFDVDITSAPSYVFYISQIIRFDRVSTQVADFNTRNKILIAKLLKQGYRYHKLRKTCFFFFFFFCCCCCFFFGKILSTLLRPGIKHSCRTQISS